ncbi:MAG: A24 family peptidase, partial [Pseudomonadota bacterium]
MWAEITLVEWAGTVTIAPLLAWLCVTDMRSFRIPDAASLTLIVFGLVSSFWLRLTDPADALLGATLGYGVFAALGAAYVARHGEEGLGLGDAKLLGAAGAWLGWRDLPMLVALAAVSALVFALLIRSRRVAFGPW